MLSIEHSRSRQRRLLERMSDDGLDAIVVGAHHHVYYLSAFQPEWKQFAGFIFEKDGKATLVSANSPAKSSAADAALAYEANWLGTLRSDQPAAVAAILHKQLDGLDVKRIGIDSSAVTANIAAALPGVRMIDEILFQLRRPKDPDELDLMKTAIRATETMYARAKQIIEPGLDEIKLFGELHASAVDRLGEPMNMPLGNDYACGAGGGPPRKGRVAQEGELWVLDLGPFYRGYFADNCRTFAVNKKPTDLQHRAWEHVVAVFKTVESMAKPGVRCGDIYDAVNHQLMLSRGKGMPHHLGHGVGLQPHEYPHLNPKWDDVLVEGEVFTAEPGEYSPELAGGLRIENDYLVTRDGVLNLLDFPMDLV